MKTLPYSKNVTSYATSRPWISAIGVTGALLALYFYRRRGGSIWALLKRGASTAASAREYLRTDASSASSRGNSVQYAGVQGNVPSHA